MIPNLSSLRFGPAKRVQALHPGVAPLGMYAVDSDDDEGDEEREETDSQRRYREEGERQQAELDARLAQEDADEKAYWPDTTYRFMASNPDERPQSLYHEYVASYGEDRHVEAALSALKRVLTGVYVSGGQKYTARAMYYDDAREFGLHYRQVDNMAWEMFLTMCARSIILDKSRDNSDLRDAFVGAVPILGL